MPPVRSALLALTAPEAAAIIPLFGRQRGRRPQRPGPRRRTSAMPVLLLQSAPPAGFADLAASAFPIVVLVFISWLLLFRPMMKEKREKQEMRDALKSG